MAHRILALWAAPRSISTAFERMMMARGDHVVEHEPFSAHYYLGPERTSRRFSDRAPEPWHHRDQIRSSIEQRARRSPIFFKDMAYHVHGFADRSFLGRFVNTFIVRDPAEALPSLFHMWPDFTDEEAGYEALWHLFEQARDLTDQTPAVIDSKDLVHDPTATVRAYCDTVGLRFMPESMEWEAASPPEWKTWDSWHADAKKSTGFSRPAKKERYAAIADEPRLTEAHTACQPYYRRLFEARLRIPV